MGEMGRMGGMFVVTTSVVSSLLGISQVTRSFGGDRTSPQRSNGEDGENWFHVRSNDFSRCRVTKADAKSRPFEGDRPSPQTGA
jgi:hypothetical protein